jgi:recombination protein RecA
VTPQTLPFSRECIDSPDVPELFELPANVRRGLAPRSLDETRLVTGEPDLDRVLGGGLARGELTEVFGPVSSGRTSIAYRALAAATRRGEIAALVDAADRFDPRRAEAAGIVLRSLLWVRPPDARAALRSAEILLATRGFGVVVLDLADGVPGALRTSLATVWERLRRRASASRSVLLLLAGDRLAGSSARLSLALHERRGSWVRPGNGLGLPLLLGLETHAEVVRERHGRAGTRAMLRFEER